MSPANLSYSQRASMPTLPYAFNHTPTTLPPFCVDVVHSDRLRRYHRLPPACAACPYPTTANFTCCGTMTAIKPDVAAHCYARAALPAVYAGDAFISHSPMATPPLCSALPILPHPPACGRTFAYAALLPARCARRLARLPARTRCCHHTLPLHTRSCRPSPCHTTTFPYAPTCHACPSPLTWLPCARCLLPPTMIFSFIPFPSRMIFLSHRRTLPRIPRTYH